MKKVILLLILMCTATSAFATTPKLARHCGGGFGEIVAGTVLGIFAADAIKSVFTPRPAPVYYYSAPVYVTYPGYVFNPYTQCYEPCYY